jgi:putative tricarboxylic transport membrane protein
VRIFLRAVGRSRCRAEDAFQLSMIGVFWSNGLVGSITTLAIVLLFWQVIDKAAGSVGRLLRPAKATG